MMMEILEELTIHGSILIDASAAFEKIYRTWSVPPSINYWPLHVYSKLILHNLLIRTTILSLNLVLLDEKIRRVEEFYEFMKETAAHTTKRIKSLSRFASYENRWVAIGDSAVSFDSLSSQGMLTALYSAKLEHYIEDTFRKYITEKRFFYNKEQRWNDEIFGKDDTKVTLRCEVIYALLAILLHIMN
ncbi:unnamed protein product [Rhizophagus irregularis]|nr:unnamed protein product [Rhizophagus irregularis]CAB5359254.1 unnamed protein product [Rhizophagus irregularis]